MVQVGSFGRLSFKEQQTLKKVFIHLGKQWVLKLRREPSHRAARGKKILETWHPPQPLLLLHIYWREMNTDVHTRTCTLRFMETFCKKKSPK